ncbi:MAG: histone deacetylase, partial [Planctomycetota bacterium]
ADPFERDRLGHLKLTKQGLRARDRLVISFYRDRGIPVALSMAGGYAPDPEDIVDIHFGSIETAWERWYQERRETSPRQ